MRRQARLIGITSSIAVCTALVMVTGVGINGQNEQRDPKTADPSTQSAEHRVTHDDFEKMKSTLSNWGRWGANDERGTLNLITPAKTAAAARLIRDGVPVTLATFRPPGNGLKYTATNFGGGPRDYSKPGIMAETITFGTHSVSHLDALCHYVTQDGKPPRVYNGHPSGFSDSGCKASSVDGPMGLPFATRAILVDLPLLRGVKTLEPKTAIYTSDLEAWEKFANVKISSGDAVLVRGGRWVLEAEKRKVDGKDFVYASMSPGLHITVLPWLKQRDIALLVGDGVNDVQPSGVIGGTGDAPGQIDRPIHNVAQVYMGLPLVDNAYLEDVAREAAARKRWEFFITVAPTRIPGGSASPFNAMAIF
jgi:kynurenine formamidase